MPSNSAPATQKSTPKNTKTTSTGPILVAVAAAFWATDALFRTPIVKTIHPTFIVLFEHVVGTAVLGLWVLLRNREHLTNFSKLTWLQLILLGAGGSAFATVLFTASFQHINPSIAILLQKLQPVLVVVFAFLFLRETPSKHFWGYAFLALVASVALSFPHFDFGFLANGIDWQSQGVIYAASAAFLWAISTVAGKSALSHVPPSVVTFWRYVFGLCTLAALMVIGGEGIPLQELQNPQILHSLLYMAFGPGILALVFYYNGLSRTTASTATFIELLYPVSAIILNWLVLHASLTPVQILAGLLLLYSVTRVSLQG